MDLEKLENFLIEKSNINKDFIKDFFGFQKINEFNKYKPFTISLDDIAFWLEMRKSKLKMLYMRSRTAKAEKVRQYYIDLEKPIDSYKDTIINNQIRKIKLLENDMKNEKYPKGGHFSYHLKKKMNLKKFIIELDNHVI